MVCRSALLFCLMLAPLSGCVAPLGLLRDDAEAGVAKKPGTYVAFGNYRAVAALSPETPNDLRQTYAEDARLSYLRALEIDPTHVPAFLALARLQQAQRDPAGALATYQKALEVTARDPVLWYELSICQARQKQFDDALQSLARACELDPGNAQYRTTLAYTQAVALARAGRPDEAVAKLVPAVGEARACYCVGRLLDRMDQPQAARPYLAAALARDPKLAGCRELLDSLENPPDGQPAAAVQRTAAAASSPQ